MLWWVKSKRAQSDQDDETWTGGGVVPTLNQFDNGDTRATVIVLYEPMSAFEENWAESKVKNALRAEASKSSHVIIWQAHQIGEVRVQENTTHTLSAFMGTGGNNTPMVAYSNPVIGFDQEVNATEDLMGTLQAGAKSGTRRQGVAYPIDDTPMGAQPTTVRRLTPMECERLQGFPDGWTTHRVDEKKGLVEQADSSRYKQMGNAVAVPVVEWIIKRLIEVHNDNTQST